MTRSAGRLLGIAIKRASGMPMELLESAGVSLAEGIERDSRGRSKRRQVTVLSAESWSETCRELGCELPWTTRRANLLVSNVDLRRRTGCLLVVGEVVLEVVCETRPCRRMDLLHGGLQQALVPDWRGGVACRVRRAGRLAVGADVALRREWVRTPLRVSRHRARAAYRRGRALLSGAKRLVWGAGAAPPEESFDD